MFAFVRLSRFGVKTVIVPTYCKAFGNPSLPPPQGVPFCESANVAFSGITVRRSFKRMWSSPVLDLMFYCGQFLLQPFYAALARNSSEFRIWLLDYCNCDQSVTGIFLLANLSQDTPVKMAKFHLLLKLLLLIW